MTGGEPMTPDAAGGLLRAAFAHLPLPAALVDPAGGVVAATDAARHGPTSLTALLDDEPAVQDAIGRARATGTPVTVQVAAGDDGEQVVTVTPLRDIDETSPPCLVTCGDPAGRQAERERDALATRLEEVRTDAGFYASRVAHDLKGPVTVMRGFAELITPETPPDKVAVLRERILANADTAAELIEDLVAASRATRQHEAVDLEATLDEALAAAAPDLTAAGASVERSAVLPTVTGSGPALRQVLTNVLRNAARFHRDGVPPTITVGLDDPEDDWWHVTVTDDGIGVPVDERARVLRPGQRGSNAKEHPGSGLGLAVCRDVLHAMGGAIAVEDRPDGGPGTVVRLTVPRDPATDGPRP